MQLFDTKSKKSWCIVQIGINIYQSFVVSSVFVTLLKQHTMLQFATVAIRNKKALKILASLEDQNLLQIVSSSEMKLSPAKKKRAVAFLKSYREAQLGAAGKIKLKSVDELLNEL
jgi:hypothetical protein